MPPRIEPLRNASGWMAGYEPDQQILTIIFQNGSSYDFTGVPPDIAKGFLESSSPGRYYNTYIRGVY
jgi:hypothetical protein